MIAESFKNYNFKSVCVFASGVADSTENDILKYKKGLCPIAEKIGPKLVQNKTNYWDISGAEKQASILRKTLMNFQ